MGANLDDLCGCNAGESGHPIGAPIGHDLHIKG